MLVIKELNITEFKTLLIDQNNDIAYVRLDKSLTIIKESLVYPLLLKTTKWINNEMQLTK